MQLMDSKSAELERLLSQLSDVNDSMRNAMGGRNDTRAHTLTRHRDILHDYQQVQLLYGPCSCAWHCLMLMCDSVEKLLYTPTVSHAFGCSAHVHMKSTIASLSVAGVQAA